MASAYVPYDGPVVTRDEARAAGLLRYFTGKPCLRGHLSERHLVNGRCRTCFYLLRKPRTDKARQTDRIWGKKMRATNRDQWLTIKRAYYRKNAAKIAAENEAARKKNPDRARSRVRNYRARKRQAQGQHTAADIATILKAQSGRCAYCREKVGDRYHIDHITPLSRGGTNDRGNLQIACGKCNRSKSAIDPIQFAQRLGRSL